MERATPESESVYFRLDLKNGDLDLWDEPWPRMLNRKAVHMIVDTDDLIVYCNKDDGSNRHHLFGYARRKP